MQIKDKFGYIEVNKIVRVNKPIKWDENNDIYVPIKYKKNNKIHSKKIKLTEIYKIGVEYIPVLYKNGTIKTLKCVGWVIDKEYKKIENIHYLYIKKIRKKIREYGTMMITHEKEIIVTDSLNREIKRKNKIYLCKFDKNFKFDTVTKTATDRRRKRKNFNK